MGLLSLQLKILTNITFWRKFSESNFSIQIPVYLLTCSGSARLPDNPLVKSLPNLVNFQTMGVPLALLPIYRTRL